jgi:hypothetical protein
MTLWKIPTLILCLFKNANLIKAYLILNPFSYVFFTCTSFLCYLNINMRAEKQNSVAMLPKISIGFSPEVSFTTRWVIVYIPVIEMAIDVNQTTHKPFTLLPCFSFLSPIIKTVPIGSTFLYILLDHANRI